MDASIPMRHPHRRCFHACLVTAAIGCTGTIAVHNWRDVERMPIDEALRLTEEDLTEAEMHLVAGVLHREGMALVRALQSMASRDDLAGTEAKNAIYYIKMSINR